MARKEGKLQMRHSTIGYYQLKRALAHLNNQYSEYKFAQTEILHRRFSLTDAMDIIKRKMEELKAASK